MKRVLIIAAHPDDEVLGCGGLISKHIKSDIEFFVQIVGEGSTCRFQNPNDTKATPAILQRQKATREAMQSLGVKHFSFENFPCGRFDQIPIIEINKLIEHAISDFRPDTIFTHSQHDANNDHRLVHRATVMSTRPVDTSSVKNLYAYEVLSSSEWSYT